MANVRCPNCSHVWKTDRGVITHTYTSDWSDDEIRMVRESIEALHRETPLPLAMDEFPLADWGSQADLMSVVNVIADGTEF